jgi:glycosyltransferase involved in cell wall biosynthesis
MKVLILSYHYPPAREVGGLRARKIALSLRDRGAGVAVVAGPLESAHSPAIDEGVIVHRVRPGLDLRSFYLRLTRASGSAQNGANGPSEAPPSTTDPDAGGRAWVPPERVPFIKRQISAAMWLPDDHQGWIRPAARKATDLIRGGVNVLYSTAPPFSVHLAGLLAKRRTGVTWLAEFRDPWTGNPWKPAFVRSSWSDSIERWLETRCLRSADRVIAVTDSVADRFRIRAGAAAAARVHVVRNGIDRLDPCPERSSPARSVIYVGTLYQGRDPRPFLGAVAEIRKEGDLPSGFRIDFIGHCRWLAGASIERFVSESGLSDMVTFTDHLPHDQCLDRIRHADLLLLLAQQQPSQVPNKLYEYLGVRKPILAFVDPDGESAAMLRQVGGHHIVDDDRSGHVTRIVREAIVGADRGPAVGAGNVLMEWTTDKQMALLNDVIEASTR